MIDRWISHLYGEAIQAQTDELWSAAVAEGCAFTCLSLSVGSDRDLEMETARLEQIGSEIRSLVINGGSSFLTKQGSAQRSPCDPQSPSSTVLTLRSSSVTLNGLPMNRTLWSRTPWWTMASSVYPDM